MTRRQLRIRDMRRANVPERFWDVTLNRIPDSMDYKAKIRKYLENIEEMMDKGIAVYLWSPENSTGKTSLAVILLKEFLRRGYTGFFEESSRLKAELINKTEFESGVSLESRIASVDVLVIDDIGKEYRTSSGYAENALETLIRGRAQRVKLTIMTGNLSPKQFKDIYSNDFAALLMECSIPIRVSGMDFRAETTKYLQKLLGGDA